MISLDISVDWVYIATNLREEKLWIQTSCRPGEEWASSGYSCLRHATWVLALQPKPVYGTSESITYPWYGYGKRT